MTSLRRRQMRANIPARVTQLESSFRDLTHMLISAGVLEIDRSGPQPVIQAKREPIITPLADTQEEERT